MQAVDRNTDAASVPRVYRNRPQSLAFISPRPDPLCEAIYLVDADTQLREEICACFSALGTKVIAFTTAAEYLDFVGRDTAACLVLNTHLPDISGFELQGQLTAKMSPSVIFRPGIEMLWQIDRHAYVQVDYGSFFAGPSLRHSGHQQNLGYSAAVVGYRF